MTFKIAPNSGRLLLIVRFARGGWLRFQRQRSLARVAKLLVERRQIHRFQLVPAGHHIAEIVLQSSQRLRLRIGWRGIGIVHQPIEPGELPIYLRKSCRRGGAIGGRARSRAFPLRGWPSISIAAPRQPGRPDWRPARKSCQSALAARSSAPRPWPPLQTRNPSSPPDPSPLGIALRGRSWDVATRGSIFTSSGAA